MTSNKFGMVAGVVTAIPSVKSDEYDSLGYGLAIPNVVVQKYLKAAIEKNFAEIQAVPFEPISGGIKTKIG